MFQIFVEALDVYAYHGVPDEERAIGHRYLIDVMLEVDGLADTTDAIEDTVDYAAAAKVVEGIAKRSKFHTVERLAAAIADELIDTFGMASAAVVKVRKPMPPAPIIAASVGTTVTRQRSRPS